MVISWYGQSCFKIQSGESVIITDPFDKSIGLTPPRQVGANIVTVSHGHGDHNNVSAISGNPFIIDGPGEYEVGGTKIQGIFSYHDNDEGAERGSNTIYVIDFEGIRICHLGDLGQKKLNEDQLDKMDGIDILMVPVGGHATLDAEMANGIINQIEPRIVIPMHYKVAGLAFPLDSVDNFIKELGMGKKEAVDKLTLKKKDLPEEGMDVIIMKL